jgi:hypothetical protein
MNVWWCNQGHSWREEYADGVVRASDVVSNPTFRRTVGEAKAGDIIVHYHASNVIAFSRAEEDGRYQANLPAGYESGWEFRTEYHVLEEPLHRDVFRHEIHVPDTVGFAWNRAGAVNRGYFYRFSLDGLAVILAHLSPDERLPQWLGRGTKPGPEPPPVEEREVRMKEGNRYVEHLKRERNQGLAEEAKRVHGYVCQVCRFDFERFYGPAGAGYIEAHHIVPFHTLPDDAEVTLSPKDDFAVVCANCHRMLHRDPYPTVAELRATVAQRRSSHSQR